MREWIMRVRVGMLVTGVVGFYLTWGLGWTLADPGLWGYLVACMVAGMLVWEWEHRSKK